MKPIMPIYADSNRSCHKKAARIHRHIGLALLLAALVLGVLAAQPSLAQEQPPGSETSNPVTPNDVNEVARQLWCPLCSGVRLDACELKACEQMRDVIRIKLEEGQDSEAIKAYFVEQYGPQVLGEPPKEGFNLLAWVLPFVALMAGAVFLFFRIRRMVRPQPALATLAPEPGAAPAPGSGDPSHGAGDDMDEYARKLEEELQRYG